MVVPPERIAALFGLAKTCMDPDDSWTVAANRPDAKLSHRPCPWGGHLVRFDCPRMFIHTAPEKSEELLCRPELRGSHDDGWSEIKVELRETLAPGDAICQRSSDMWIFRLGAVLFGDCSGSFPSSFFYDQEPTLSRHQLRRDFPEPGDCCYAVFQEQHGAYQEAVIVCRNLGEPKRFHVVLMFSTPQDKWPSWADALFPLVADMVQKATLRYLNRPALIDMHVADSQYYMALTMRSFNRGPPLLPCSKELAEVSITAGQEHGLSYWRRFQCDKFRMAEYLRRFMEAIGLELQVHETLDGRSMVPYQCVVARAEWQRVHPHFLQAFNLQKAAYRRSNGGTTAPSVVEGVRPHLVQREEVPAAEVLVIKTVVRNTFLEFAEPELEAWSPRDLRRSKSVDGFE